MGQNNRRWGGTRRLIGGSLTVALVTTVPLISAPPAHASVRTSVGAPTATTTPTTQPCPPPPPPCPAGGTGGSGGSTSGGGTPRTGGSLGAATGAATQIRSLTAAQVAAERRRYHGPLAFTGVRTAILVAAGALLVASGAGMVHFEKRRRRWVGAGPLPRRPVKLR